MVRYQRNEHQQSECIAKQKVIKLCKGWALRISLKSKAVPKVSHMENSETLFTGELKNVQLIVAKNNFVATKRMYMSKKTNLQLEKNYHY